MQHCNIIAQYVGKYMGKHYKAVKQYYAAESIQLLKKPSFIYVLSCKFNYRIEN